MDELGYGLLQENERIVPLPKPTVQYLCHCMCLRAKRGFATTMKLIMASWPFGRMCTMMECWPKSTVAQKLQDLSDPLSARSLLPLSSFFCWVSRSLSLAINSGSFCGELARGLPRAVAGRMASKALPFNSGVGGVRKALEPRAAGRESAGRSGHSAARHQGGRWSCARQCPTAKLGMANSARQLCFEIQRAATTSRWTRTQTDT